MRGFWHIVDAVLASLIIIGFLMIASQTVVTQTEPERLNEVAYELLQGLDDQGVLKSCVAQLDATTLNAQVAFFSRNHSIEICGYSGDCTGTRPGENNVWVGNYITAGYGDYQPSIVRLYLW